MSTTETVSRAGLSAEQAHAIAVNAYIFYYPLITMEITRRQMTDKRGSGGLGHGPMNQLSHARQFPPAEYRGVVRPNFDTLYTVGWFDLTRGPVVLDTPDTGGRFYLMPMLDMWSDVFAVPGWRTTGTQAGKFAVVPPGFAGEVPAGAQRIDAPTHYVWLIGRIQTNGASDYAHVNGLQDGLSLSGAPSEQVAYDGLDLEAAPLDLVNNMNAAAYFELGAELMKLHPPHVTDQPLLAQMKRVGLLPFQPGAISQDGLQRAVADGLQAMRDRLPTMARVVNGWQMNTDTMGVYGNYYLKRAIVAMVGLGANLPDDAIYPMCTADSQGRPFDGSHRYVVHFARGAAPPVDAFWSITMYDNDGFQVANSINRFAIGDRDALEYNADGSLDIYVQADAPGDGRTSNWLPAPRTPFNLTMRLYAPRSEALVGKWSPPAVERVD